VDHTAWLLRLVLSVVLSVAAVIPSQAQYTSPRQPAIPLEPVAAILAAFRSHSVVALGEGLHGNEQGHAYRLALIRDPRFAATVNDIVVECGNARYQDVMDRFVRGDDVSDDALRPVWQDTTQNSAVWDRPIYEEFFRAVPAVNASLPREGQLRVLLGDPPADWANVLRGTEELGKWIRDRDRYPVDVILRDVLAKQRRALVIYGDSHLFRAGQSLVSLLESRAATRIFTIATAMSTKFEDLSVLQADLTSWNVPSMAIVRGTVLDAKQFKYYDAVLYLGPPPAITFSRISPVLCTDQRYMEMRLRRMALSHNSQVQVEQLKRECATVVAR